MIADRLVVRTDARDGNCWTGPERWWDAWPRASEPPVGMRCISAVVHAVVAWSREASDTRFHDGLKCNHWEVVVPELVFEPDA